MVGTVDTPYVSGKHGTHLKMEDGSIRHGFWTGDASRILEVFGAGERLILVERRKPVVLRSRGDHAARGGPKKLTVGDTGHIHPHGNCLSCAHVNKARAFPQQSREAFPC